MAPFQDFAFAEPLSCKGSKAYETKRHVDAGGSFATRSLEPGSCRSGLTKNDAEPRKRKAGESSCKKKDKQTKTADGQTGFIHVRARRGEATDSHSLAERVRREKISERMKFLQNLVPGCNNITGKALMLDEIINYVQSLQRQVEFLSWKLAAVNAPMYLGYCNLYNEFESADVENGVFWSAISEGFAGSNGLQRMDVMDPYNVELEIETAAFQCLDFHGSFEDVKMEM